MILSVRPFVLSTVNGEASNVAVLRCCGWSWWSNFSFSRFSFSHRERSPVPSLYGVDFHFEVHQTNQRRVTGMVPTVPYWKPSVQYHFYHVMIKSQIWKFTLILLQDLKNHTTFFILPYTSCVFRASVNFHIWDFILTWWNDIALRIFSEENASSTIPNPIYSCAVFIHSSP